MRSCQGEFAVFFLDIKNELHSSIIIPRQAQQRKGQTAALYNRVGFSLLLIVYLVQGHSEVVGDLTPHADDNSSRHLPLVDVQNALERQLLEVQPVRLIVVRANLQPPPPPSPPHRQQNEEV